MMAIWVATTPALIFPHLELFQKCSSGYNTIDPVRQVHPPRPHPSPSLCINFRFSTNSLAYGCRWAYNNPIIRYVYDVGRWDTAP